MQLTDFGIIVRKHRLDARITVKSMAKELGVSYTFLLSMENGKKKIPKIWIKRIEDFFKSKGLEINNLNMASDISNGFIKLDECPLRVKHILVRIAHTQYESVKLDAIENLL